jgi:hypothetical protein
MGRALLGGDVHDGATIRVDVKGDELVVDYLNRCSEAARCLNLA